jgi:hypothetical protein
MSIVPSIETLPVELLHRIFDDLDAETILLSIRPVCRLFRSVVNTYNRYVFNVKSISKLNLYILCRLLKPQNVISLILSNDEQSSDRIHLFISLVRLRQFTRLRSLTLLNIDEGQLNFVLKRININFLTSFAFNIRKFDFRRKKTTSNLLTSIIAQSTLHILKFDIDTTRMAMISWPINCTIRYLTIDNGKNMDNLYTILQCSPHLHTLIMPQSLAVINDLSSLCFRQITSLTIEKVDVTIDKLESFLSLTPSLVYLKLIGSGKLLDGKRWEQFIEISLPQLDKFEFGFKEGRLNIQTPEELELIIASFRTPFWIEHKRWFVTCEYEYDYLHTVSLYSLPICQSSMHYEPKLKKQLLSTHPNMMSNDLSIMDNINSLSLTLSQSIADDIQEKVCYSGIEVLHLDRNRKIQ